MYNRFYALVFNKKVNTNVLKIQPCVYNDTGTFCFNTLRSINSNYFRKRTGHNSFASVSLFVENSKLDCNSLTVFRLK